MSITRISLMHVMVLASLALLPGCMKEFRYETKHVPMLNNHTTHFEQTRHGITIQAKKINEAETRNLFNGYGKHLNARKGYIPVMINITNNTNSSWTITPQDIEIPQATFHHLKKAVHHNTAARVSLIALAGAIITIPTLITGGLALPWALLAGGKFTAAAVITMGAGMSVGIATTSTATLEGMRSKAQNINIEEDIARTALLHELSINPTKKITKIIFIPKKEFVNNFQLTVTNANNELDTINFNVNLAQK